jgi:hypothetical protein
MSTTEYQESLSPSNPLLAAARDYLSQGLSVVPVPYQTDSPVLPDGLTTPLTEEDLPRHFDGSPQNIGVVLGPPSGDLVAVGFAGPMPMALAVDLLPDTPFISGLEDGSRLQFFYACKGIHPCRFSDPDGTSLVEVRGQGGVALLPPSTLASGESYLSLRDGAPAVVAKDELLKVIGTMAGIALLAHHWPEQRRRRKAANALVGALLRAGFSAEEAAMVLTRVRGAAGDKANDSDAIARKAAKRIASGERVYGFPTLAELVGEAVAKRALDWLAGEKLGDCAGPVQEVEAARASLENLYAELKKDPAVAFRDDMIGALALVRKHDPGGWARAKSDMQRAKVSVRDVEKEILKRANHGLRLVEPGEPEEPRTAGRMLGPDCPYPELVLPPGYKLRPEAMVEIEEHFDPQTHELVDVENIIAHAPIILGRSLRDVDDGSQSLEVLYQRGGKWHSIIGDRRGVLDERRIIELASTGAPVASTNAKKLVDYLHQLEGLNYEALPVSRTSAHFGWQGPQGNLGFLVGPQLVNPDGTLVPSVGTGGGTGAAVEFVGVAGGDDQLAKAIHAPGSLEPWLSAVRVIYGYPRVLVGLLAAFVPPLFEVIGGPNFILDWAARTSTGKTTSLRISASVWGNPDEHDVDSLVGSWDSTTVWIERASAILTGLPVFLDETQRAKDANAVAKVLYEVAQGRGRGRGNPKGISRVRTWQTVLFSTGEMPATTFTTDGGTRARCVEITGSPFGQSNTETAALVSGLNATVCANYGHAGPLVVQWLLSHRDLWGDLQDAYRSSISDYSGSVPLKSKVDRAIVDRLAHYFAAIHTAGVVASAALDLPYEFQDPLKQVWHEVVTQLSGAGMEERALRDVMSWAWAHQESFYGRHQIINPGFSKSERVPAGGWAGRWSKEASWTFIAFYPTALKRVLTELGYNPDAVLPGWKDRGWLDVGAGRTYDKSIRVGAENPNLIVVRRKAIVEVEGAG